MDGPEGAARLDGWRAAVPAGAVAAGLAVLAVERAGRPDATQVVVEAGLRDAAAVSRAARRDVADALPAATDERRGARGGQPDDPAEPRDARDARQDGRDARRDDPAVCRADPDDRRAGRAERPVGQAARRYRDGQAARLHRDDRDVGPEDARRVGPDERRGDDPGHPGAKRREAA